MTKELKVPNGDQKPYGKVNDRRGANYRDAAVAFLEAYPIGSTLSVDKFDAWAESQGLLKIPENCSRKDDAWKAHCQRRHEAKHNLKMASAHPGMTEKGAIAFVLEGIGPSTLLVRTPFQAISDNKMMGSVRSLCGTKRKALAYMMQAIDWTKLEPHWAMFAESLFEDITDFQEQLEVTTRQIERKYDKLGARIKRALASGEIPAPALAISQFVEQELFPVDPDEPDEEDPFLGTE